MAKNLLRYIERKEWSVLSVDGNSDNDWLSVTPEKTNLDIYSNLENIRKSNSKKIFIGHLNINSIRNKFDFLADIVKDNIDILMISESKLDDSFPDSQFLIEGFGKPFRLDRNRNGGGIMWFIRSDIPAKVISTDKNPFESFYVELNFRKKKWLLSCSYNPNNENIESHLNGLTRSIASLSLKYENIILLGDFNSCMDDSPMIGFVKLTNYVT